MDEFVNDEVRQKYEENRKNIIKRKPPKYLNKSKGIAKRKRSGLRKCPKCKRMDRLTDDGTGLKICPRCYLAYVEDYRD